MAVVFDPYATRRMGEDAEGNPIEYREGSCLSTDEKPTSNIYQRSWLLELDTKDVKFFDAENQTWR